MQESCQLTKCQIVSQIKSNKIKNLINIIKRKKSIKNSIKNNSKINGINNME